MYDAIKMRLRGPTVNVPGAVATLQPAVGSDTAPPHALIDPQQPSAAAAGAAEATAAAGGLRGEVEGTVGDGSDHAQQPVGVLIGSGLGGEGGRSLFEGSIHGLGGGGGIAPSHGNGGGMGTVGCSE